MSGNLGGGREGVMRSEYQSNSDMKRAQLQAQLLQQGFNQAQGQANTAFGQQGQLMAGANTLGADQQRMASLVPGLYGQDISTLGQRALTNKHKNKLSLINKEKLTDLQHTNHTKDLVTWVLVWVMLWVVRWVNINHKLHLINRRCSRR